MRVFVRVLICLALIGSLLTVVNVVSDDSEATTVQVTFGEGVTVVKIDTSGGSPPYPQYSVSSGSMVEDYYSIRAVPSNAEYGVIYLNGVNMGSSMTPVLVSDYPDGIHFEAIRDDYSITFERNGGSGDLIDPLISLGNGDDFSIPTIPFLIVGKKADVWNTRADGTGDDINLGDHSFDLDFIRSNYTVTSPNLTLYPKWYFVNYSVSFNANNGSGQLPDVLNNRTIETGANIPNINLTRTGYHCDRWNTQSDGSGYDINPGLMELNDQSIPLYFSSSTNLILYPKWIANNYTINYNASNINGSTPDPIPSFQIGSNITISSATFYRNGYDFLGWNTSENGSGATLDPGDHSVNVTFIESVFGEGTTANLYPIWSIKTYSISLSTEYGTVSGDGWSADNGTFRKSFNVESDEVTIPSPSTDDRFHSFVCWEDRSGNTVSSISSGSYGDVALTAVWKNVDYALKLNINGVTYDRTFTIDDDMPVPDCEDGFEFVGWFYTDDNGNEVRFISMSQMYENMSIYAVFEPTSDDPVVTIVIVSSLIVFFAAAMIFAFRKE